MVIETRNETEKLIVSECQEVATLLIEKNRAYGNSAIDPVRIFSKASPREQILVRLDDKLSRLARGTETDKIPEDIHRDIIGYLVLLKVLEAQEKKPS